MKITIETEVTYQRLADLLCSAFACGSNYWYTITKYNEPKELTFRSSPDNVFEYLDYPLNEGGSVVIETRERDEIDSATSWTLDLNRVEKGLKILAKDYPQHFADFISDKDDSTTGDVFLQCCLFGEVVFG